MQEKKKEKIKYFVFSFFVLFFVQLFISITNILPNANNVSISVGFIVETILSTLIEEYVFRYLLIYKLGNFDNKIIFLSSIIFGILHFDGFLIIYHLFCGLVFGFLYKKTLDIKYPVLLHLLDNFVIIFLS